MSRKIISKDPWPALPIDQYHTVEDGPWGYLIFFDDGDFNFVVSEVPSEQEILAIWGGYLRLTLAESEAP